MALVLKLSLLRFSLAIACALVFVPPAEDEDGDGAVTSGAYPDLDVNTAFLPPRGERLLRPGTPDAAR